MLVYYSANYDALLKETEVPFKTFSLRRLIEAKMRFSRDISLSSLKMPQNTRATKTISNNVLKANDNDIFLTSRTNVRILIIPNEFQFVKPF